MTSSREYWEQRKQQRIWESLEEAEDIAKEIGELYKNASNYLNGEIDKIFDRFKSKHKLSTAEAKRILNSMEDPTSFEEMLRKLKSGVSSEEKAELIKLLESPAYRARINRLEKLQSDIDVMMREVYHQEKDFNTRHYINTAYDSYYKSIYDIQKDTGLGFSFNHLDQSLVDKLLKSKWSGLNYSSRIWNNTQAVADEVKKQILLGIMTGKTVNEMVVEVTNKFQVGAYKARRLIVTEDSYIVGQVELQSYEECEAETYIFVATLDLETCPEYCRPLDGKRFKVKDAKVGVNYHPMHPHCRCTTIIGLDDETLTKLQRRARDPKTGDTYKVPANMSYEEWFKQQQEKFDADSLGVIQNKSKNYSKDKDQFQNYIDVLGKENVPKTFEEFQDMKYNDGGRWSELKSAYKEVNWQTKCLNKHFLGEEHRVPTSHEPYSVYDKIVNGEIVQRRFYGKTGKPRLDIDLTDHGNSNQHTVVPHYHAWTEINERLSRDLSHDKSLTLGQRIANKDILGEK